MPRRIGAVSGFADEAQVHVKAGDGGAGSVSFRREAHVSRGGPDGGDGGNGGDVWLVASTNQASLLGFRDHPHRRATDGKHGQGKKRHGPRGQRPRGARPGGDHGAGTRGRHARRPGQRPVTAGWRPGRAGVGGATPDSCPTGAGRRASPSRARRARSAGSTSSSSCWPTWPWWGCPNSGKSTLISRHLGGRVPRWPTIPSPPSNPISVWSGWAGPATRPSSWWPTSPGWWRGRPRAGASGTASCATSSGPAPWWCCSTWPPPTAMPAAEQERILLAELGRYRPELLERPRVVVGSKADVGPWGRRRGRTRVHHLGRHRERGSPTCWSGWPPW